MLCINSVLYFIFKSSYIRMLRRNEIMRFYSQLVLIVVYITSVSCYLSFVNELPKCGKADKNCHVELCEKVTQIMARNGIPELDIPQIDPYILKNTSVSIFNMLDIVLEEGNIIGLKDCKIETSFIDFEKKNVQKDKMCDQLIIEGRYTVSSTSLLKKMLGNIEVHGGGKVKIVYKKTYLGFVMPFDLVKKDDGTHNIYIKCRHDETQYMFDIFESANLDLDNVFLDDHDISGLVVDFFNKNWKVITSLFGKYYDDIALDINYSTIEKFFIGVPTKYFITDNLSSFVN